MVSLPFFELVATHIRRNILEHLRALVRQILLPGLLPEARVQRPGSEAALVDSTGYHNRGVGNLDRGHILPMRAGVVGI